MLVEEVMTTHLVTCDADATVRDATESMLRNRIGSVVVTDGGTPAGILTESDVLHAGYVTDDPLSAIPVREAASAPLVTVRPDATLRRRPPGRRSPSWRSCSVGGRGSSPRATSRTESS